MNKIKVKLIFSIQYNPYDGEYQIKIYADYYDKDATLKDWQNALGRMWSKIKHWQEKQQLLKERPKRKSLIEIKWEVFERDNFTCQKCGSRKFLEVDHIIPRSKKGEDNLSNYQTLCKECNRKKYNKT